MIIRVNLDYYEYILRSDTTTFCKVLVTLAKLQLKRYANLFILFGYIHKKVRH